MKHTKLAAILSVACAGALAMGMLGGCASEATTEEEEAQQANNEYMSSVNSIMEELDEELESFTDAVSRDDVVGMSTQADNAYEVLDELEELEAPEDLSEIHEDYLAGADSLEQALDAYVDLYTEIDAAEDDEDFDWSTYEDRLAEVQDLYDEGIAQFEAADTAAAEME